VWWTGERIRDRDIQFVRTDIAQTAWNLLDEADIVVGYNQKSFDIPTLQREIVTSIGKPPSPFRQVDLYQVVRRQFRFASNKLDYVAEQLKVGRKVRHEGHDLWTKVIAGDERAWLRMQKYCCRDVRITAGVYGVLLPWIPAHPNVAIIDALGGLRCPSCGSLRFHREGSAFTAAGAYQRYKCNDCGRWFRPTKRSHGGESAAA
jgi:DNA-directed RNA polymerase subunit RPC12/RpoP